MAKTRVWTEGDLTVKHISKSIDSETTRGKCIGGIVAGYTHNSFLFSAPDYFFDPFDQPAGAKRLHDIVNGSDLKAEPLIDVTPLCRQ